MEQYDKTVIPVIESVYGTFTPVEKNIADYFIRNKEKADFSARQVSQLLYVSEASLSRFAKKCGFKGYREFLFRYEQSLNPEPSATDDITKKALNTYQELLNKSYSLVDEAQMRRLIRIFTEKKRIFVYGLGSSGLAGQEMKFRFMRLGVDIEAITDTHVMRMNSVVLGKDCAVVAISVSGKTPEVMESLALAGKAGAATVLMTSHKEREYEGFCDEVVLIAVKDHLENGRAISPQFPISVMVDIFYAHFLEADKGRREALHSYTVNALTTY